MKIFHDNYSIKVAIAYCAAGYTTAILISEGLEVVAAVLLLIVLSILSLLPKKSELSNTDTGTKPKTEQTPITPISINSVLLQRQPTHIVIDLGLRPDVQTPASLKARVLLNPYMAKLLMLGLMQTVEEHEQEHGVIKTPSREDIRARAEHAKLLNALGDINLN